jgi:hypothetical protein
MKVELKTEVVFPEIHRRMRQTRRLEIPITLPRSRPSGPNAIAFWYRHRWCDQVQVGSTWHVCAGHNGTVLISHCLIRQNNKRKFYY